MKHFLAHFHIKDFYPNNERNKTKKDLHIYLHCRTVCMNAPWTQTYFFFQAFIMQHAFILQCAMGTAVYHNFITHSFLTYTGRPIVFFFLFILDLRAIYKMILYSEWPKISVDRQPFWRFFFTHLKYLQFFEILGDIFFSLRFHVKVSEKYILWIVCFYI